MKKTLICLTLALLIGGCKDDSKLDVAIKEINQSHQKILELEKNLENLNKTVKNDKDSYEWDKLFSTFERVAYLTPGSEDYKAVRFDLGVLTASLIDIKPYANGTKVTLEFGNTLSATITGLKATIDWGKIDEKGSPINEQAKSKEITFNEALLPGAWTNVSVVLEGVPAGEFGFIRIKDIHHSGIRLLKNK